MDKKGALHLIPLPIAENALHTLLPQSIERIHSLKYFVAENARTSRRFISSTSPPYRLEDVSVSELDKHAPNDPARLLAPLKEGHDVGLMSEAGCPGIADPGSGMVEWAHRNGYKVVPHVGPSSIVLAMMASGMNGQNFTFHGYLPRDNSALASVLKRLENTSRKNASAEIFIETPYRNRKMIDALMSSLSDGTRVCIACGLTGADEFIEVHTIGEWQRIKIPDLHKRPAVFILQTN